MLLCSFLDRNSTWQTSIEQKNSCLRQVTSITFQHLVYLQYESFDAVRRADCFFLRRRLPAKEKKNNISALSASRAKRVVNSYLCFTSGFESFNYTVLIFLGHLMIQRQQDAAVLGVPRFPTGFCRLPGGQPQSPGPLPHDHGCELA